LLTLVGRANVGKSRLFNRLVGAQRALVENRPGVTRDRIVAPARIEGREVLVVDTGGLDPEAEAGIPAAVLAQVEHVLEEASVILLVVDVREGMLPLDKQIADRLRHAAARVLVVANKADAPALEAAAMEFHALGFPEIIPTSAEHKLGIADLELAVAERLPDPDPAAERPMGDAPRVAIVGRPNAGKSSLLNRLLGEEQAIVSEIPGTTRDATDSQLTVDGREVVLIDTAGLRRPGRRSDHLERGCAYMALRAIERADLALLVLDAEAGVSDQDAKIARLALDCGRALVLVLNKWDLIEDARRREQISRQLDRKLGFVRDPVVLRVSAKTGRGTTHVLPAALTLLDELDQEVSTADVNRALQEAVTRHPPPMGGQRGARFYYATKTNEDLVSAVHRAPVRERSTFDLAQLSQVS
jgi:GTP-binding protein